MKRINSSFAFCVLLAAWFVLPCPAQRKEEKPKQTLADAFRAFHKGMSSTKKEERLAALQGILFTKKDIEILFPKDASKLWEKMEPAREHLLKNCDKIAKEVTRHGALKEINPKDIRASDEAKGSYRRLLAMIPKDVPVFGLHSRGESGGGGYSETYVFVNGRWIFIRDLDALPEVLDKEK